MLGNFFLRLLVLPNEVVKLVLDGIRRGMVNGVSVEPTDIRVL